eukprot:Opistho-2@16726
MLSSRLRLSLRAFTAVSRSVGAVAANVSSPGPSLCLSPSPFNHPHIFASYGAAFTTRQYSSKVESEELEISTPHKALDPVFKGSADDVEDAIGACNIAIPVHDPYKAWSFYHLTLGLPCTKKTEHSLTFNIAGHSLRCVAVDESYRQKDHFSPDTNHLPFPSVGFQVSLRDFHFLVNRIIEDTTNFVHHPTIVDENENTARWIMQLRDPSGNVIEFYSPLFPQEIYVKFQVIEKDPAAQTTI